LIIVSASGPTSGGRFHHEETKSTKILPKFLRALRFFVVETFRWVSGPLAETTTIADNCRHFIESLTPLIR
jgi:hypothetical protein